MPTVRMTVKLSGTRDGVEWPALGETLEVSTDEAAQLVGSRLAVHVEKVESASAPAPVENAAMKRAPRKPKD